MNILLVKLTKSYYGGEKQTEELVRELKKRGHKIIFCGLPKSELSRKLSDIKSEIFSLYPYPDSKKETIIFLLLMPYHLIRAYFLLKKLISKYKIQIICLQEPYEKIIFSPLARLFGIKVVWQEILYWEPYLTRNFPIFWLLKIVAGSANGIVATSDFLAKQLKRLIKINQLGTIKHSLTPADLDKFKNNQYRTGKIKTIGFAGSISNPKGVYTLLSAFARINDQQLNLLFAGDGSESANLSAKINQLNLGERVMLLGKQNINDFFLQIDLLVVPSLYDNLPYIIQEAMVAKIPIIASDAGGIPELFCQENKKWLFSVGDELALTEKINQMLKQSEEERKTITNLNKQFINQHFNFNVMIEKTVKFYEHLLD